MRAFLMEVLVVRGEGMHKQLTDDPCKGESRKVTTSPFTASGGILCSIPSGDQGGILAMLYLGEGGGCVDAGGLVGNVSGLVPIGL